MEPRRPLDAGVEIHNPSWRPGHDQTRLLDRRREGPEFQLINADGTGLRRIEGVSPDAVSNDPIFSLDGSRLVYTTWADGADLQGRIHVVDIDTGVDRALMFDGSEGTNEFPYQFSPDGSQLLLGRHGGDASFEVNGEQGYRLVVVPASGEGPVIPIGRRCRPQTNGASAEFYPDGTQVLAFYNYDRIDLAARGRRFGRQGGRLGPPGRIPGSASLPEHTTASARAAWGRPPAA